ncbi:MAG TPA: MFS transporter [Bacteroidales bacterium]|nr:MFS transporter [Bacteroidales bacterium]HPT11611.1 MFS transporter [Bacteroidales bacterium]
MSTTSTNEKMTNYRWVICGLLFFATTVNYLDRQVLSLTWKDFIAPEFHWTNTDYGNITSFFSICYAIFMLFAGKFVDWMDTRKGYLWAIGIWSVGAILHAFCGIGAAGYIADKWTLSFEGARNAIKAVDNAGLIASSSVGLFMFARAVLALGESGNFPAAIKSTAEYFPKKDRAFSTSIFNSGATVGALIAPVTIPTIAARFGWEMSFLIIGALGFIWMGFWIFLYKKPHDNHKVNKAELDYILQDKAAESVKNNDIEKEGKSMPYLQCFKYKQTWAFAVGKFMTDGVWWFYLFWAPAYLSEVYGYTSNSLMSKTLIFVLYAITMLSIIGGWLPTYFVDKKGMNPYDGRMRAMLIFAFFPLLALMAQPLGHISPWFPIIIIGIAAAAHQAWSANIFSTVGDMFPKAAIATVTGIGGMAGGVGSYIILKGSGKLFDYASGTTMIGNNTVVMTKELLAQGSQYVSGPLRFMGFEGIRAGYFIVFCFCAVAYIIGWLIMKSLVPKFKLIED